MSALCPRTKTMYPSLTRTTYPSLAEAFQPDSPVLLALVDEINQADRTRPRSRARGAACSAEASLDPLRRDTIQVVLRGDRPYQGRSRRARLNFRLVGERLHFLPRNPIFASMKAGTMSLADPSSDVVGWMLRRIREGRALLEGRLSTRSLKPC